MRYEGNDITFRSVKLSLKPSIDLDAIRYQIAPDILLVVAGARAIGQVRSTPLCDRHTEYTRLQK
ncbi:hypothetical protein [Microcoleus sp. bin38.metabat.b11b12b14.051]|uniref:hypothetical protein n=1 Tax=Microcoleus sp. bin38.metabat.b11b12b14.051 TaxID=2742709 RepID=UPI0025E94344|nr:hypothetical protein [Microcoleus sp. bin38.metabat.b11b12b14.051]